MFPIFSVGGNERRSGSRPLHSGGTGPSVPRDGHRRGQPHPRRLPRGPGQTENVTRQTLLSAQSGGNHCGAPGVWMVHTGLPARLHSQGRGDESMNN